MNSSPASPKIGKSLRRGFAYWFGVGIPDRGSGMFVKMALAMVTIVWTTWLGQPDWRYPDESLMIFGATLVAFFLLVALVGRLWECHVHRKIERVLLRGRIPARHRGERN